MSISALAPAILPATAIAAGVGLFGVYRLFAGNPDATADQHDVSDYYVPRLAPARLAPARRNWPLLDVDTTIRRRIRGDEVLPPAPAGMDAGSPVWRRLVVEQVVPTLSDAEVRDIAARMLREIAAEQQARTLAGAR